MVSLLKLGDKILIEGLGIFSVEDTGRFGEKDRIQDIWTVDVFEPNHEKAIKGGTRSKESLDIGGIKMTYKELFAATGLLSDIRQGRKLKIHPNAKIGLASVEDYFKDILSDADKPKVKSNANEMVYQMRIEVNR